MQVALDSQIRNSRQILTIVFLLHSSGGHVNKRDAKSVSPLRMQKTKYQAVESAVDPVESTYQAEYKSSFGRASPQKIVQNQYHNA